MSYTRPQYFEPGAYLRACDLCGIRYRSTQLVRGEDGFWRCTVSRGCAEMPAITRDRISAASQRRREAPPPRWGAPYTQQDAYADEARLFNFLVEQPVTITGGIRRGVPPADTVDVTGGGFGAVGADSYVAAGETCRYLYDLITEAKRPAPWIADAKVKLAALADYLVGKQNVTGNVDTNIAFGGFNQATILGGNAAYTCFETSCAGLALLLAYQVLRTSSYLTGARNAAHMARAFQWSSQAQFLFTSSDSAGTVRLYTGGHSQRLGFDVGNSRLVFDSQYLPSDLLAVEFLARLKAVDGDATYGGLGNSGTQQFVTTGAATLTTAITDALAFWKTGTIEASSNVVITGLSASTPRELFNAYPATKAAGFVAGTGNWEYQDAGFATGTKLSGTNFALALRSLYAVSGYTTQVAAVWSWLMGFSSNPTYVATSGDLPTDSSVATSSNAVNPTAPPAGQGNTVAAAYNPKLALARRLLVRDSSNGYAAIAQNTASGSPAVVLYQWECAGLLAAIQASQDAGSLRKAKDAIVATRLRMPVGLVQEREPAQDWLFLKGLSGLAFQTDPSISSSLATWSAVFAARIGSVFRYGNQGQLSAGRPDKTQPGGQPGTLQVQS